MKYLSAVDDCFLDSPGGMGRVAWDIAQLMRERGHEVAMLASGLDAGRAPTCEERCGIRIVRFARPQLAALDPRRARLSVDQAALAATRHLADEAWDVAHLHTLFTSAGAMRALGKGPRYVTTVHSPAGLEVRTNWARQGLLGRVKTLLGGRSIDALERSLLDASESIHVLSQFTASLLEELWGLTDRVSVIPHWHRPELQRRHTKSEARAKLGWSSDAPLLLTVRGHAERQGIDSAIEALAPLCIAGRCTFVAAGDGPRRKEFEAMALRSGAGDSILFPGRLSEADLSLAYEAADLFVLPTAALECFGLITLEALAFGCPVLATDAGATPELLAPILPSFIVPAGDVDALRASVGDFLDGRLLARPADELIAYVRSGFDRSAVADRLLALLER